MPKHFKLSLGINRKESGMTLVEVLVGVAILGIVAVSLLGGIASATKIVLLVQERNTAESLAKSQMEFLKIQDYINAGEYNPGDPSKSYQLINISDDLVEQGYQIVISPPVALPDGNDDIQRIELVVNHNTQGNNKEVLRLSDYKVNRYEE